MHLNELHQLSQLIVEIRDCFMVRRTLDRLEAEELTLQEAISGLEGFSNTPHQEAAYGTSWELSQSNAAICGDRSNRGWLASSSSTRDMNSESKTRSTQKFCHHVRVCGAENVATMEP